MNKERKLLIAGNWKMNKTVADGIALVEGLAAEVGTVSEVDILVCPPFTALYAIGQKVKGTNINLGAQTMNEHGFGAYTGEVNADMLKECAVNYVILGHSERRQYYGEKDALIATKAQAVLAAGFTPIICVGETLEQREAGKAEEVIGTQVRGSLAGLTAEQMVGTVIAYEPVWAIGTGKTATSAQAQEIHAFIRKTLTEMFSADVAKKVRILYGGSVKPANARELMSQPDVDGGLVGGASLKVADFAAIVKNSI